jgi:AraC-like DNA-binding protein
MTGANSLVPDSLVLCVDDVHHTIPAHGMIQAGYFRGFDELVRNRGGDPRKVLELHDVDPLTFDSPDRNSLECGAAVNLLEYCSHSFDDPVFGLRLAERQDPDAFGCVMALARAAPTLRSALQSLVDYVPLTVSPECEMEMVTARDVVELRWRTNSGLGECQQVNYQGLALFMKTLQMLGRDHFQPRYASLTFKIRPSEIELLQKRLGCRVYGKADAHAIAFPMDMLDRPTVTSNATVFGVLGNYLSQLRAATRCDFAERIAGYVRNELPTMRCSVEGCAERLGTSARTLQKRLAKSGLKFSDIVQSERIKLAKHALQWSDSTLDEIAFHLGYSEQTSFGRAFKRATGMTPQSYRAAKGRDRGERFPPHI